MERELLGIVRVDGKAVRFYEPPSRPDFAWVALADLVSAAGYPDVFASEPCRKLFVPDERTIHSDDGAEIVVIPHVVAFAVAGVAERQMKKGTFTAEYSAANAEATKLMSLGLTEAQWNAFCLDALEFNAHRFEQIQRKAKPVGKIRRFLDSIARIGRRSGG